jgi:hypothetical protein
MIILRCLLLAALFSVCSFSAPLTGLIIELSGQTFTLPNGNSIALLGFRGATIGEEVDTADLNGLVNSGLSSIVTYRNGSATDNGTYGGPGSLLSPFSSFVISSVDNAGSGRILDAVYVEYLPNSTIVFKNNTGTSTAGPGTQTFGLTIPGNDPSGIPEPTTVALMGTGIAGLALMRRLRKA